MAYGLSRHGSDWQEMRVRQIDAAEDYPEVLRWCKFTHLAWTHDHAGFFYSGYATPGGGPAPADQPVNRLYWHTLGTPQADDRLVYERPDRPELQFNPFITDDGTVSCAVCLARCHSAKSHLLSCRRQRRTIHSPPGCGRCALWVFGQCWTGLLLFDQPACPTWAHHRHRCRPSCPEALAGNRPITGERHRFRPTHQRPPRRCLAA